MAGMQIQRFPNKRRRGPLGCGCITLLVLSLIVVVGFVLLWPALPGIVLQLSGFKASGETAQVFATVPPPPPNLSVQNARTSNAALVDAGRYGQFDLNAAGVRVTTGQNSAGTRVASLNLSENDLMTLCRQYTQICDTGDDRVRNATVDLRPGGAVIYADVNVPGVGIWQRAGIVLRLSESRTRLDVMGIDVDGVLYQAPPQDFGISITEIESAANQIITQATLQANGNSYRVSEIYADERQLNIVLR